MDDETKTKYLEGEMLKRIDENFAQAEESLKGKVEETVQRTKEELDSLKEMAKLNISIGDAIELMCSGGAVLAWDFNYGGKEWEYRARANWAEENGTDIDIDMNNIKDFHSRHLSVPKFKPVWGQKYRVVLVIEPVGEVKEDD